MTIHYDPAELQWSFIFSWRGTIFPLVLADPMFWFLLASHVALLGWHSALRAKNGTGLPMLDWDASTVATGLLAFFVVFYANQCYQRYERLHTHCTGLSHAVTRWAQTVRTSFRQRTAATRWNMMRLMLAAMHMHYAHLRREDDEHDEPGMQMVRRMFFIRRCDT